MIKLYKFRSLKTCEELCRLKEIVDTNKFWCSKFSEMNDAMEGVYYAADTNIIKNIYHEKNEYKICSFSGELAFENPCMWGYYAGGFQGVAIEIEIEAHSSNIHKVNYEKDLKQSSEVIEILTTKLCVWKHENEYRFIDKTNEAKNYIGKISKIFFANPYGDVTNSDDIFKDNQHIRKYLDYMRELVNCAVDKEIECCYIEVINGKVVQRGINE